MTGLSVWLFILISASWNLNYFERKGRRTGEKEREGGREEGLCVNQIINHLHEFHLFTVWCLLNRRKESVLMLFSVIISLIEAVQSACNSGVGGSTMDSVSSFLGAERKSPWSFLPYRTSHNNQIVTFLLFASGWLLGWFDLSPTNGFFSWLILGFQLIFQRASMYLCFVLFLMGGSVEK